MKGVNYVLISESCSCGAKISIEHPSLREAEEFLVRWRGLHTHYPKYTYGQPNISYAGVGTSGAKYYTINGEPPEDGPALSVVGP